MGPSSVLYNELNKEIKLIFVLLKRETWIQKVYVSVL